MIAGWYRKPRGGAGWPGRLAGLLVALLLLPLLATSPAALANETLTYDANGNVQTRTLSGGTTTYGYDALNRINSEAGPAKTQSLTYDPNDNRLTDGAGSKTYSPNSDRIVTENGQSVTLDAAGNVTQARGLNSVWNGAGQLQSVSQGATLLATYVYDYKGRRTRKIATAAASQGAGTTIFVYDLYDRLKGEFDGAGNPQRTYVWRDDVPVSIIVHGSTETALYLETDHLNTPIAARDQSGKVAWKWESDAFGTTLPNEDPDGDTQTVTINLRFPGQYFDRESGLHYNWHRYYDPRLGRYLSPDPIGIAGGANLFGYARQNPLSRVDPLGLADLVYNNTTRTLTIVNAGGAEGSYPATNNAASTSRGPWPQGVYPNERYNPHPNRTAASDTGTDFFGFTVPGRTDMGVHAGRQGICDLANRCGFEHATLGCIRTTPEAMDAMRQLHLGGDPIRRLTVIR